MEDQSTADFREEVEAIKRKAEAAFASRDVDGLLRYFALDATLLFPGMDVVQGPEAIKQQYSAFYDIGAASILFESQEVEELGKEMLYDRGYIQILNAGGHTMINGKYLLLWKKVDGKWLTYCNIFNSNA